MEAPPPRSQPPSDPILFALQREGAIDHDVLERAIQYRLTLLEELRSELGVLERARALMLNPPTEG